MSTKPFAPDEEARGVKGLVEEHTASAGDREAGDRGAGGREAGDKAASDREAGDREVGDREAGDREASAREAGDRGAGTREGGGRKAGGREAGDMEEHCLAVEFSATMQDSALAIVAAATAAVANARRVFPLAGGRERAAVAAR